jgi:hypothetical protein
MTERSYVVQKQTAPPEGFDFDDGPYQVVVYAKDENQARSRGAVELGVPAHDVKATEFTRG